MAEAPTRASLLAEAHALLDEAKNYSRTSPVRLTILAEAQLVATIASLTPAPAVRTNSPAQKKKEDTK